MVVTGMQLIVLLISTLTFIELKYLLSFVTLFILLNIHV